MQSRFTIWLSLLSLTAGPAQQESYLQPLGGTGLNIEMVAVPPGRFTMGSPEDEPGHGPEEGPVREIAVEAFWMSSREITWDLYRLYLERTPDDGTETDKAQEVALDADAISGATVPYVDMSLGMGTGEGLPVGNVTRKAASRFCKWLSAKTGRFYRLPTEAEWEYAARAGSEGPYFFGPQPDSLEAYAWHAGNSGDVYHRVGQKRPNPWGLYDIYGNVAEWTLDGYDPQGYPSNDTGFVPPEGEYPGVLRGGTYRDDPGALRSAARLPSDPVWKQRDPQFPRSRWWFTDAPFAGFRIVRPATPPPPSEYARYWDTE